MVDYDKTFEFDYLMQVDQESRENAAREDSSRGSSSYSGRSFYSSGNKTKNTKISNADKGRLIIMFIIAIFVGLYFINEAHEKKSWEETVSRVREMEAQGLLGTGINTGYEEVQELNPDYITGYIDESVKEKYRVSPYEGCSYIGDDGERYKCETAIEEPEIEPEEYTPVAVIPEAQIPEAHIPEAQIPTATIPKSQTPKTQTTIQKTTSWGDSQETYYNELTDEYYDNYYEYEKSLEPYQLRGYDSYDEYFWDYFDRNKADYFDDYSDVYSDYPDYGGNYSFADFRDDFYDDHYGEYFD